MTQKTRNSSYKEKADNVLKWAQRKIKDAARDDEDKWFLINRWVYARLQKDERSMKKPIKNKLFTENPKCNRCKKKFNTIRDVHLHRNEKNKGYSEDNCVLLCKDCHDKVHKENGQ
jgi:hypothetical protein